MPKHTHDVVSACVSGSNASYAKVDTSGNVDNNGNYFWKTGYTTNTGGSKAHNNLQPYYCVYIWERIS
jgi:microcystin-dependent protein